MHRNLHHKSKGGKGGAPVWKLRWRERAETTSAREERRRPARGEQHRKWEPEWLRKMLDSLDTYTDWSPRRDRKAALS